MPVDEAQHVLLFFASPPRQNTAAGHDAPLTSRTSEGGMGEPLPIVRQLEGRRFCSGKSGRRLSTA